ncbi:MAG: hypothetical protein PWQ29_1299 [Verrucomicrobiota bacterium]|jgi:ElaB/YqjD/DUF883 family membrane-anchored ribosome-binding protein|nr:hypothetical protein [Verrucomicrobiota bacterium]MDK2963905.1 hypothetical protein [Verrucomicrobiota bacterium]
MTTKPTATTAKISEALELLNEAAREQKNEFSGLIADKYDDLKKAMMSVESEIEAKALRGVRKMQEVSQEASAGIKHVAENVDKKAHEDPWKTFSWVIAGAFIVGFLLGNKKD